MNMQFEDRNVASQLNQSTRLQCESQLKFLHWMSGRPLVVRHIAKPTEVNMLTLPQIVEFQARKYVATRLRVDIPFDTGVDPAFDELWDAFARAGVEPDGIEFIKFNLIDVPRLEIEVGMTTDRTLPLSGRLVLGELPSGRYVSSTYTGSYDGLYDATAMLIGWAKERGIKWDVRSMENGDLFASRLEIHVNNPSIEPDPSKLVTTLMIKMADGAGLK
jgi:effector-binding domain-containing protein